MHFLDDVSPIRLYTDASAYGIGGVLFQIVDDLWKPIAFVSKSLTPVQLKWPTIQTEAYAIFTCCTQLGHLITSFYDPHGPQEPDLYYQEL
jgi:RNase H-like domain found in reverse transcriptase